MRKAILVGVCLPDTNDFNENIEEMKNLAEACDIRIQHVVTQNLRTPHKKTYINSGKCEEIQDILSEDIDLLLFDHELSPSQQRNLEVYFNCLIMDKTALILDIFALRAKTKEARLQVEVARLKYALPRLSGSYTSLDRQRGGDKNRGAGEKKLELDVRNIESRIHSLEKEIKEVSRQRMTQRRKRIKNKMKCVALVGYTNAGKSSLLNAIMDKENREDKKVLEKDMLFATLTTSTRNITLDDHLSFLLSDTVGFVNDLPHTLIKAFHSTLEEVMEADLLLHVIDISHPAYAKHIDVTKETLREIQAAHIPLLTIYNKCDLSDVPYPLVKDDKLYLSTKDTKSIDLLMNVLRDQLFQLHHTTLCIPYEHGALLATLNENAKVLSQTYETDGIYVECELEQALYEKVKSYCR